MVIILTSPITWRTAGLYAVIFNLAKDEVPFYFGFNGNWVSSLTLADVSVRCPIASFIRKYIPRVSKRNIWAFYEIKTMMIKIKMTTMMVEKGKSQGQSRIQQPIDRRVFIDVIIIGVMIININFSLVL